MALEREKNKLVLEKCQEVLKDLLKDEDNKYCVDCDAKSPRWASWNIGIFLCIRCAGIHRNLGVHISKVKSVNLDTWTPQQVSCIQQMGNSRARAVYEANLQDNFRRPQTDSSLEQFIRAKYEAKKYIAKEWVPPPLPNPTWDLEIENQLKKKREKKSAGGNVEFPAIPVKNQISKSGGASPKPLPKAPGGRNNSPNQCKRLSGSALNSNKEPSSGTVDLLGLDTQTTVTATTTNGAIDSEGDIFGDFLAAPAAPSPARSTPEEVINSTQNDESNFFNQKLPEPSSEKMSKDSILALYSQTPAHPMPQQQQQPLFGVGGGGVGMFMGGPAVPGSIPHSGMVPSIPHSGMVPSPQQQPNMMLYQQQQQKGLGVGPVQGSYFPQAMPGIGGQMYPGMVPGVPHNIPGPGVGVQLSAANPFAQMQSQMGNLNIGGMMGPIQAPPHHLNPNPAAAAMMIGSNMMVNSGHGMSSNPSQHNALSANLWQ